MQKKNYFVADVIEIMMRQWIKKLCIDIKMVSLHI